MPLWRGQGQFYLLLYHGVPPPAVARVTEGPLYHIRRRQSKLSYVKTTSVGFTKTQVGVNEYVLVTCVLVIRT